MSDPSGFGGVVDKEIYWWSIYLRILQLINLENNKVKYIEKGWEFVLERIYGSDWKKYQRELLNKKLY